MKDYIDLRKNYDRSDDAAKSPKRRRIGSGNTRALYILLGIPLALLFVAAILFFFHILRTIDKVGPLESKITAQEQKISGIEKRLKEVQGRLSASCVPDPALVERVDALDQTVEELKKQKLSTAESRTKPSSPSKPAVSIERQYYSVQEGDTLFRISAKYGISVQTLRELNNLSENQPIRKGQKLQISPHPGRDAGFPTKKDHDKEL